MRHFFTVSVFALAALLGACNNNPTTPTATTGEIYGTCRLFSEYEVQLIDNSGLVAQLLEGDKVIQSTLTASDGSYSFKDVRAGVYGFRFFKQGFRCIDFFSKSYLPDTSHIKNIQFVGNGRFELDASELHADYFSFVSTATQDSSYFTLKTDILYKITKQVIDINDVWIKDTLINGIKVNIYGRGTKETRKVSFTIEYEKPLLLSWMRRVVDFSDGYRIISYANELSGIYEYDSPNIIVRDSLGKIVNNLGQLGSYTKIIEKEKRIHASSEIPNGFKNEPRKRSITKELKLSLTD